MIEYSQTTGDTSYLNILKDFADNHFEYNNAKYAGYDDAQWAGITLIKAYSLFGEKKYLSRSIEMWNHIIKNAWDNDFCNGGLWWNYEQTYKNAITNELFIVFSTMLYIETNENKYKDWALKTWKWFDETGMISSKTDDNSVIFLVNDGINTSCKSNKRDIWTYNQGVLIGGLVNLWKIFEDSKYLNTAINIATSSINNLTKNGILVEKPKPGIVRESLNTDQQQFKSIFVRYLTMLIQALPDSNFNKVVFINFIKRNYEKVCKIYTDNKIGKLWDKKNTDNDFNAISQTSGLDLFISRLKTIH